MAARIIDGKALAAEIREGLKPRIDALRLKGVHPCLCVILVGDDPASRVYVRNKGKACQEVGILSREHRLPASASQGELLTLVESLNRDPSVHGILVQLPLPKGIDPKPVLDAIDPAKDVDGFHPVNVGRLMIGEPLFPPCTPAGVLRLLEHAGVPLAGANAVVVGRSNIVGKPAALLLLQKDATVTLAHSRTRDLAGLCRRADILVAAIGKPRFITADMVRPGAAVIDVGINRLPDGKLAGDVDEAPCAQVAGWITPVPGGVGPMTITMLLENTLLAASR
ncbi:MAG: bifunctional methylenetetrahydrofolate dehydrogenase/methenyltetrahydrofolate cyclohydrolase FolD [Spirochaetes bacterium]|nr:bifunctional methylenetetrahydrofolate dehydrogenase/methenyltetrahydrofolate cyclohydrolase FolD [Spirochaetota bacterium]